MAAIGVNWAGVVVTLTESETKSLETAEDVASSAAALIGAIAAVPTGCPPLAIVGGVVGGYLQLDKALLGAIDEGNGIFLTLPWLAIYFWQLWLIIPTAVPAPPVQSRGSISSRTRIGPKARISVRSSRHSPM